MNRREILQMLAATTVPLFGQRADAAATPLRVLILGGTGFIGPHTITALRRGGHQITLFNNDKESAKKFPQLESLFGDRDGKIEALSGRDWDVVIDNSGYVPRHVKLTADALQDHVGHYIFISSISAYADLSKPGIDEDYPLATLKDPSVEKVTDETYGGLKAACENVVREVYGSRYTVIRPTYIVGPGDPTDRFTYWPVRVSQGGEMLAPGTSGDPAQFIDVRDLAEFIAACAEHRHVGQLQSLQPTAQRQHGPASRLQPEDLQGRYEGRLGRCEIHRSPEVRGQRDPDLVTDGGRVRRSGPGQIGSCRGEGPEVPPAGRDRERHARVACHTSPRAA